MRKKGWKRGMVIALTGVFLANTLGGLPMVGAAGETGTADSAMQLYVSADGRADAQGTLEDPFSSLEKREMPFER